MRRYMALSLSALVAAAGCATGTRVESAGDVAPATPLTGAFLPMGTTMRVRLNESVGTVSSREGDEFTATVVDAVRAQNGADAVPVGSLVYGRVTGVHHSAIPGEQSVIRLAFDSIRVRGLSYPFAGEISEVHMETELTDPTKASVEKTAGVGAVAGAALGAIIGGPALSHLITGGLLGAATGTVISLGMGTEQTVIPSGTHMMVRSIEAVRLQ